MKYLYNRVIAYFIDMLLVVLVVTLLSKISFINPNLENYNKYNRLYNELNLSYQNYVIDLQKYFSDSKLSDKEFNKLFKKYNDIAIPLTAYYEDGILSNKEYDKVINETNSNYMILNKKYYYYLSKYSLVYNIIMFVCLCLYFIWFNVITDGQSLGKRLFNLKIVNINDGKVSLMSYIIRCILLYNPIYYIVMLVGSLFLKVNSFYNYALVFSNIKNYFIMLIFAFVMFRKDNRGLHDLAAKTKVIDVKNNNEEKLEVEYIKNDTKKKKKNKRVIIDDKEN